MPDADPGDPQGGALSCTARPGSAPAPPPRSSRPSRCSPSLAAPPPTAPPPPPPPTPAPALLLAALLPPPPRAQDVRRFTPAPTPSPYLTLDGARTLGAGELGLRLLSAVEQRPLVFARDGEATVEIIDLRLALDLAAAYGLTDWLDLGLSLPLVAAQRGRAIEADTPLATTALADPALALKARLIDPRHGAGLALRLSATAPWGDPAALAGEPGYTAAAVLALELPLHHRFDLALNAGYRLRPRTALGAIPLDDELAFGAAASWRATPAVALAAEFSAATAAADPFARPQQTPGALDLTTRIALTGPLAAVAGVGLGLLPGYGAPLYRAFIGVELAPRWHDHDGDGLADGRDRCLDTPGVPAEAGCPPPPVAAAPEAPADRDTDGLPDLADQCPLLAEDHDGYRDDDGCPDPDNDLDLLADGFDADPLAPEDWDDFEDADGRPDLDNDRDGLADDRDPCPTEKGGPDGCPESLATAERLPRADGPDAPLVLGRTLHPARPLPFTRAALAPEAAPLLDGLAAYLAAHPELDRLEIGVHTDGRGSAPRKRALARARAAAVRAALVTRGVDPARLFTRGYGPDVPVDTDQTAAGRANNRRVELRALMPFEATPTEPRRPEERRARPRAATPEAQPRASREPRR
ncbi:MAG: OmpA family protein [Myxococcales bacterium]|nr:OmpA family protein [Myxococcales bacterium]